MNKTPTWALAASIVLATPFAVRAQHMAHDVTMEHEPSGRAAPSGGGHAAAAPGERVARTIEIAVTSEGFVPARVNVERGEKLRLAITRTATKTCATEIVVGDHGIRQPLPLGETVYVELTPTRRGETRFACGMDMVSGILVVQ